MRDWGHARDYVEMQWLMLQQPAPEDFVIASGEQHSVREFVQRAARELGITITFHGGGVDEVGIVEHVEPDPRGARIVPACKPGEIVVRVDPRYFRPTEVETLLGDASRARERLGWTPRTGFAELVREMIEADYAAARRDALIRLAGFQAFNHLE